jgi:hypothetical protein
MLEVHRFGRSDVANENLESATIEKALRADVAAATTFMFMAPANFPRAR